SEEATTNLNELDFSSEATLTVTAQDSETTTKSAERRTGDVNTDASLLSFIFKAEDNPFEEDIEATIDQEALTVTAQVPFGTDRSALIADITNSEGATTNLDELDFSSEATLTVTAQDSETTTDYAVNITEGIDPLITERAALIAIYNSIENNTLNWPVEDETSNINNWPGVTVNEEGRVIKLNMDHQNIVSLSENIGDLTMLKELSLFRAKVQKLPESIGNLTALETFNLI